MGGHRVSRPKVIIVNIVRTKFLMSFEFTSGENGLVGLEIHITMKQVALEAETEKWRQLSKDNAILKDKIDQSRLLDYY